MKNKKSLKTIILLGFASLTSAAFVTVSVLNKETLTVDATDFIYSSIKFEKNGDNWSRSTSGYKYVTSAQLSGGDIVYSYTENNGYTDTGIAAMRSGDGPLRFTTDNTGSTAYKFQLITAVKVTFESNNVNFNIMTSNNDSSYLDNACTTGTFNNNYKLEDLHTRYVKISVADSEVKTVASVEIFYTCSYNYSEDPVIDSVSLNKSSTTIVKGSTETLVATVEGSGDYDDTVSWSTGNSGIATVSNGVVTAVSAGTTTITATSNGDGTKSATCTVTVTEEAITISGVFTYLYYGNPAARFTFSNDGTVVYEYVGVASLNATYVISDTSITFTFVSYVGTSKLDDFGNYRLFNGSATTNNTGSFTDENTLSLKIYTAMGGSSTKTFNKNS